MINGHRQGDCERFALVALFKRATVSDSDPSLLTKEQPWQIARFLWAKSNMSDFLVNQAARSQIERFVIQFDSFSMIFPFFMPKNEWLPSLFTKSLFFGSNSLSSLFTKEQLWAIRSCCSWQKSDGSDSLFFTTESLFGSQKMSDSLEKPMIEFPTLGTGNSINQWMSFHWSFKGKLGYFLILFSCSSLYSLKSIIIILLNSSLLKRTLST